MNAARHRPALVGLSALALVLSGCGGDKKDNAGSQPAAKSDTSAKPMTFVLDDKAVGPAPPVAGAVQGGTIRVLDSADVAHLDPARIYVNSYSAASNLITRTLTGYKQDGKTVTLVGDLATNTGVTKDKGKTWTYTLRDGITWEDGSPITAQDIKYGVERNFAPDYTEGPSYIQNWLTGVADFRKKYNGPYGGKELDAIATPNAKTIVFHFTKPHPDMPFAAALTTTAPVKKAKDTKLKYDTRPFASGPYKIAEHKIDKSLKLVRNTAWKPESDPIRYQYVDTFDFQFGDQQLAQYQRILAANGGDAAAIPFLSNVAPELLPQVTANPELVARTVQGYTPYSFYFFINQKRMTNLEVRKAMLIAWPRQQIRQIEGGPLKGDLSTTISGPTLIGHEDNNQFNVTPEGDPARARAMLEAAGKLNQKVVYAYPRRNTLEQEAVAIKEALTKAGFDVVLKPLSDKNYYDEIGKVDNSFDVYEGGWGFDWPSGSSMYQPLFDGRHIVDDTTNYAFFDDPAIDKEIDRISAIVDPLAAAKDWAALDRRIMAEVPCIPFRYDKIFMLPGPKVGNTTLDQVLGIINLNGLYVKP